MVDFKIGGHFSQFPVDLLTLERDRLETKCQAARIRCEEEEDKVVQEEESDLYEGAVGRQLTFSEQRIQ